MPTVHREDGFCTLQRVQIHPIKLLEAWRGMHG